MTVKKICAALLLIGGAAIVAGFLGELRLDRAARAIPMTGQLVDIGGHRLRIDCVGQGSPTVLFELGAGDPGIAVQRLQAELAGLTGSCSYNRAGLGWSDAGPEPRDAEHIAQELSALLDVARTPAPYIVVGHSLGGLFARVFTAQHRDRVAALILLDSSHEDQEKRFPKDVPTHAPWSPLTPIRVKLGLHRLSPPCNGRSDADEVLRQITCQAKAVLATASEWRAFDATSEQARRARDLGDLPLLVISADPATRKPPSLAPLASELQADFLRLSTRSSQEIAAGCGHDLPRECPEIVIAGIRKMVARVR